MMASLLWFLACGALLAAAGTVLTRAADTIATRTGMGRVFVGSLLLAGATSLPELSTDISAVVIGEPDLAVGDLFGSSIANLAILALLTLLTRGALLRRASPSNLHAGGLAIALTLGAAALVLARPTTTLLGVSPGSLLLLALFVAGTRATYRLSSAEVRDAAASGSRPAEEPDAARARGPAAMAIAQFIVAAAVTVLIAPFFASVAVDLAERSGLGTTFVGTWMLGFTTSVPELVSTITAVRMRAYDLAIANVFGSNCFNMVVFLALDLVHPTGSIFSAVSSVHAVTALGAVLLMSLTLVTMRRRT